MAVAEDIVVGVALVRAPGHAAVAPAPVLAHVIVVAGATAPPDLREADHRGHREVIHVPAPGRVADLAQASAAQ